MSIAVHACRQAVAYLVLVRCELPVTSIPDSDNAAEVIRKAQTYATDIIRATISPYKGARQIWKACRLKLERDDHRLDPFVYWASEYEDTSDADRRALCDRAIREAANHLIEHGTAI